MSVYCVAMTVEQKLSMTHPELAKELVDGDPKTLSKGSHTKCTWKCHLGHNWKATVITRTSGQGCPYCSGKQVLVGFNDLATTHPELAKELVDGDPKKLSKGSRTKFTWKCHLGHTWKAAVKNRTVGYGCHFCSGIKVWTGFNDLVTTHPELAKELVDGDPKKLSKGSHTKFTWKCHLGHNWKVTVNTRTSGQDCPYCSGKRVLVGFNDLATTNPELAQQASGWDPTTVTAGVDKKVKWSCQLGHKWDATVGNRSRESGCPSCAIYGFDPNKDGYIYFITHSDWEMYQIGITSDLKRRLSEHSLNGWELIESRGPMDGYLTQQWETAILLMLKAKGADLSNAKIAGKFNGYSEAWSKSSFEVKSIQELMRLTEDFESLSAE